MKRLILLLELKINKNLMTLKLIVKLKKWKLKCRKNFLENNNKNSSSNNKTQMKKY